MKRVRPMETIANVAWKFHKSTGIEFEELFGEAALAYAEALVSHNPEEGKFLTWTTKLMKNRLCEVCTKYKNRKSIEVRLDQTFSIDSPEDIIQILCDTKDLSRNLEFRDFFLSKSEWEQVFNIITSSPHEFLSMPPKMARGKIRDELRSRGWKWQKIWQTIREIKIVLTETYQQKYNISRKNQS